MQTLTAYVEEESKKNEEHLLHIVLKTTFLLLFLPVLSIEILYVEKTKFTILKYSYNVLVWNSLSNVEKRRLHIKIKKNNIKMTQNSSNVWLDRKYDPAAAEINRTNHLFLCRVDPYLVTFCDSDKCID